MSNKKPDETPDYEDLAQQIAELTDALQRERADSINLRRQYETQLESSRQNSLVRVVRELLPAIDNLERALKHTPSDLKDHDYIKGVQAVVKQFEKIFNDLGIQKIRTVGEVFDPRLHEAVHLDDSDSQGQTEIVSEELQPGYLLGGEVIRHAMVNVRLKS
jgi:molecular chaperone GrpE